MPANDSVYFNWYNIKSVNEVVKTKRPKSRRVVVLACDPGKTNYGYAVLSGVVSETGVSKIKILQFGRVQPTLMDISAHNPVMQLTTHIDILVNVVHKFKVTHVIAERYMSRGHGGTTIELVNIMLGALMLTAALKGLQCKVVPASQWKNEVKRNESKLDDVYAALKAATPAPRGSPELSVSPHAIDAVHIGIYALFFMSHLKPFSDGVSYESLLMESIKVHKDLV